MAAIPTLQPSTATGFTHELRFPHVPGEEKHIEMVPFHGYNLVGTPEVALEGDEVVAHLALERNSESGVSAEAPDPYGTFALASREPATGVEPDHSGMAIGWGSEVKWHLTNRGLLGSTYEVFLNGAPGLHFPVARDSGREWPRILEVGEELDLYGFVGFSDWVEPSDAQYFSLENGEVTVQLHRLGLWPWNDLNGLDVAPYAVEHLQRDIGAPGNGDYDWHWGPNLGAQGMDFPPVNQSDYLGIHLVAMEGDQSPLGEETEDWEFDPEAALHLGSEGTTHYWVWAYED